MVYDTFYNNIYFIANYQTEVDKALDKANTGKGQKYISPDTHIYLLENDKLKKIYSSNRKLIYRLLPEENGNLLFLPFGDRKPVFALCSGTALVEVISRALKEKPKSTNEELTMALNLYLQTVNETA